MYTKEESQPAWKVATTPNPRSRSPSPFSPSSRVSTHSSTALVTPSDTTTVQNRLISSQPRRSTVCKKKSRKKEAERTSSAPTSPVIKKRTRHPSNRVSEKQVPLISKDELIIGEELGKGVFKATLRGTVVAVKELLKDQNLEQFEMEIGILNRIRHPNVVLFMGASLDPPLIVTEYLEGGNLHTIIENYHELINKKKEVIPLNRAVSLALEIAKGMLWLHHSIPPILHKDLRPMNIMINSEGTAKIMDFGLSEVQKSKEIENKKIVDKASWMAPEMLQGIHYNEKIDVFAFGIIMWQLFTGSPTVYDTSRYEGLPPSEAFQNFTTDIIGGMRPSIPESLKTGMPILSYIMESAWALDPDDRPSFSALVKQLQRAYIIAVLQDPDAEEMWFSNFDNKVKVLTESFCHTLFNACHHPYPQSEGDPNYFKLQALKAVLLNSPQSKVVHINRFGLLLHWYGPLIMKHQSDTYLLDKLLGILQCKYFHGELSADEAERILMQDNDNFKRDFLVRTSYNPTAPFVISRLEKKGGKPTLSHHRVYYDKLSTEYSLKMAQQNIQALTIPDLIRTAKTYLGLKKPIKCRKFLIFLENPTCLGYEYS